MSEESLTDLEQDALELIRDEGSVLQSNLWKKLDCSASKGSNIARKLEELELVLREKTKANGSSTFELKAAAMDAEELDFSILLAGDLLPPFIDDENADIQDERFTEWIMNLDAEYG